MYSIRYSKQFKKDFKRHRHDKPALSEMKSVIACIASGDKLPAKHRNHRLSGEFRHYMECHIRPDLLLVYEIRNEELLLLLLRLGSHSELFG